MPRRHPPPILIAVLLAVVLAGSVGGGWVVASRVSGDPPASVGAPDPAEPTYDAGDPTEAPPPAPAAETAPRASTQPARPAAEPAPARPSPATPSAAAPRDDPGPRPAPAAPRDIPEPQPQPEPQPEPEPEPTPAPRPDRTTTPYAPPPAIGIAAEALPSDGASWAQLLATRRAASAASQERTDLDWLIAFARAAATPGQPEGRRATARRALRVNAWWYARRPAPAERVIARDPDGIILTYKRGHGFLVNPVATLGRWRGLNEMWTPAQLADAMLPMLVERSADGREWAALEYFDVPGSPDAVRAGVSAMAQSRAASLFAKAHANTGDARYLVAAQRTLRAFAVPVDEGGVLARVPDPEGGPPGPWYPERAYPGRPAWTGAALNGFMVTIIELQRAARSLDAAPVPPVAPADAAATTGTTGTTGSDTAPAPAPATAAAGTGTPDPAATAQLARDLAARAETSLERFLPLHDSGNWSFYGLLTPGKPWRTYLADLNYHCYHVSLLRTLAELYPGSGHAATARRWQGYVDAKGATCPAR